MRVHTTRYALWPATKAVAQDFIRTTGDYLLLIPWGSAAALVLSTLVAIFRIAIVRDLAGTAFNRLPLGQTFGLLLHGSLFQRFISLPLGSFCTWVHDSLL
jgi:hypothetical protein